MKRVLDVAEMKQIHGGAAVSNLCASGEIKGVVKNRCCRITSR